MSLYLGFPKQPLRANVTLQSIDVKNVEARARRTLTRLEMEGHGGVPAMLMRLPSEQLGE